MTLVRKADGQLVETVVQGTAAAPQPTTPAGSAAAGASPDQAKMSGTPAQKRPVLEAAVAPQDTLQAAVRAQAAQPTGPAPSAYDQAKEKLGSLQGYGSYANRIQAIMQTRLAAMDAVVPALDVSQSALQTQFGDRPEVKATVEAALRAYLADRSEANLLKLAQAMAGAGGDAGAQLEALKGTGITSMLQGTDEALGAFGKGMAKVTVADLAAANADKGIEAWNLDQLAGDLGVERSKLDTMSVDEFQAALTGAIAREGGRTQALQAELESASPQRAQQIFQELAALGVSGLQAVEAKAQAMAESLDAQEVIQYKGKPVSINALLADDTISTDIRNAVNGGAEGIKALEAAEPVLGAWVRTHYTALQAVVSEAQADVTASLDVQADLQKSIEGLGPKVLAALGIDTSKPLSAEQLATVKATLANSPLVTALRGPEGERLATLLKTNPEVIDALKGMRPEDAKVLLDTNAAIGAVSDDEGTALAALGLPYTGWITDPAAAASTKALLDVVRTYPEGAASLPSVVAEVQKYSGADARLASLKTAEGLKYFLATQHMAKEALVSPVLADAYRKFMGLSKFTGDFLGPDDSLEVAERKSSAFYAAQPNITQAGLTAQFAELVRRGVIDTAAELDLLAKDPEAIQRVVDADNDARLLAAVHKTKDPAKIAEVVADLVLGPQATAKQLMQAVASANAEIKYKGANSDDARAFLKLVGPYLPYSGNDDSKPAYGKDFYAAVPKTSAQDVLNGRPSSPFAALRSNATIQRLAEALQTGRTDTAKDLFGGFASGESARQAAEARRKADAEIPVGEPFEVLVNTKSSVTPQFDGGRVVDERIEVPVYEIRQKYADGHVAVVGTKEGTPSVTRSYLDMNGRRIFV